MQMRFSFNRMQLHCDICDIFIFLNVIKKSFENNEKGRYGSHHISCSHNYFKIFIISLTRYIITNRYGDIRVTIV